MKIAFLYAGQGSQHPGMGADLYAQSVPFRQAFDAAITELDFDCKEVCFTDKDGVMGRTEYTQPCMVAFAVGVTTALQAYGIVPEVVAGLSLGEYSALYAAGVFDASAAVAIVAKRGKAMAQAAQGVPCGMTAVLGLEAEILEECCALAQHECGATVQICNYNCPGQIVIGGDATAVAHCATLAKNAGAKRCLPLKVSGAFHTALMQPAGETLKEVFANSVFAQARIPVLFNTLGRERVKGDATVPELLVQQVQSSVQMEAMIRRLVTLGVDTVIEIGPGKVLSGFVKKTVGSTIACYTVETQADLQALATQLGKV